MRAALWPDDSCSVVPRSLQSRSSPSGSCSPSVWGFLSAPVVGMLLEVSEKQANNKVLFVLEAGL